MSKPAAFHRTALALAATMLVAGLPAMAQDALTAAEVRAKLESQGYTNVNDVEFEDGIWTADARSADGNRVDLSIDPKTGEVYPDEQVATLVRRIKDMAIILKNALPPSILEGVIQDVVGKGRQS